MLTLIVFTLIVLVAASTAQAQTPAPAPCTPADKTIQVKVTEAVFVPGDLTYAVVNNGSAPLTWVRLGMGAGAPVQLPNDITPHISKTPPHWRATTIRSEDGTRAHFSFEASTPDVAVAPHERVELGLRATRSRMARPGLAPIDFSILPFSAGDAAGRCWFGAATGRRLEPDSGYQAGVSGVVVRAISDGGQTRLLVDAPSAEFLLRVSDKPVFISIPLALTWGVKGGFSADASIGIGMSWSPSKYVSASARVSGGTFLFNHWTHLQTGGVDINIPIGRTVFAEGVSRDNKFLVVGIEYFHRSVTRKIGFLDGPAWYTSGNGIAIRIGIRKLTWETGP